MRTIAVLLAAWTSLAGAQERERLPVEQLRTFVEVYGAVRQHYIRQLDHEVLIRNAIEGLVKSDPNAAYLSPEEFRELQAGPNPAVASIGVEVTEREGGLRIVSAMEGTPAFRAGLRPHDQVLKVDGVGVQDMRLAEAVKLLRGEPGSAVRLSIQRRGESAPREVDLVREVIRIQPVRSHLVNADVAYVRVMQFNEHAAGIVARHLSALLSRAEPKLLVLDVRASPGGLLRSCVASAALFLPDHAPVVRIDGRTADSRREFRAAPEDYLARGQADPRAALPAAARSVRMAVLVDSGTAAGSEFVAAALRDNRRAILVGEQTFGRGVVQTIFPLGANAGALKLTTGVYQSPGGVPFEGVGLRPDLSVAERVAPEDFGDEARDAVLRAAIDHFLGPRQRARPSTASAAPLVISDSIF
ncbi:MAG TPA: S41 family peptidase [Burkholderiales bacterium]|nr:S41 family peptidase [Burkholderiales bacterium]